MRPSGQVIAPAPSGSSAAPKVSFQSPAYSRPSFHTILPPLELPSAFHVPSSFVPSGATHVPLTLYSFPARHSPRWFEPSAAVRVPNPLDLPSLNSPVYFLPSDVVVVP